MSTAGVEKVVCMEDILFTSFSRIIFLQIADECLENGCNVEDIDNLIGEEPQHSMLL
jgi:hypothetical protein